MTALYLAGKMRGIADLNFPMFDAAAAWLRARGFDVFNPADNDRKLKAAGVELNIRKCMGDDLAWICAHADAVALLPGWESSLGATAEKCTAAAIGAQIFYLYKVNGEWHASHDHRSDL
jgi:hypothetical protein